MQVSVVVKETKRSTCHVLFGMPLDGVLQVIFGALFRSKFYVRAGEPS